MTQAQINEEAKANFEREMQKLKKYFRTHGIYTLIYTDQDLANPDTVFDDIKKHLIPEKAAAQLRLGIMEDFKNFKV